MRAILRSTAVLALVVVWTAGDSIGQPEAPEKQLLREDFVLAGIDGELVGGEEGWFFEFESAVSDGKGQVKAGDSLELLPSLTLEKIASDAGKRVSRSCRLWGKVTKYGEENFIFPVYFLPLSKVGGEAGQGEANEAAMSEPNDVLDIPAEILAQLQSKKVARPIEAGGEGRGGREGVLFNRTGFIAERGKGEFLFELDALGLGIEWGAFNILPSEALERALRVRAASPEPVRFKVAGSITKYKGQRYLLLQRAVRSYSHGNFAR